MLALRRQLSENSEAPLLATINVGTLTLTGRNQELADFLRRRLVDIACIQETKEESARSRIAAVDQSDRLMSIKIDTGRKFSVFICAYAPLTVCKEVEKIMFWQELNDYITSISQDDTPAWSRPQWS
ncbi:unnamed protein product [Strongylus vulgaris]|uniref:Endonuclease/exonuclease/phosphatase domain-containing protein n=1 Tax=Strongylus vulgaris TaxID=40348 RepID=A0A3P7L6X0_STRVU|nr:unnamed protein product [Strongylus vulgaris]